jgi:hypothetical protein
MMMSMAGKKGSMLFLAKAGAIWLSCRRRRHRQWCAASGHCGLKPPARGLIRARDVKSRFGGGGGLEWSYL